MKPVADDPRSRPVRSLPNFIEEGGAARGFHAGARDPLASHILQTAICREDAPRILPAMGTVGACRIAGPWRPSPIVPMGLRHRRSIIIKDAQKPSLMRVALLP